MKLRTSPFNSPDTSLAVTHFGQTVLHPVSHIYWGYALVLSQSRKWVFFPSSVLNVFIFFSYENTFTMFCCKISDYVEICLINSTKTSYIFSNLHHMFQEIRNQIQALLEDFFTCMALAATGVTHTNHVSLWKCCTAASASNSFPKWHGLAFKVGIQ